MILYMKLRKYYNDNADDLQNENSHSVDKKNLANLLNLSHNYSEQDHRYCPMCEKSISLKENRNHIGGCYNVRKKCLKLHVKLLLKSAG